MPELQKLKASLNVLNVEHDLNESETEKNITSRKFQSDEM